MISVIVPVYNAQIYVAKCLESILTQDWEDIEVIVVDDGSTDASVSIIKEFVEKDYRVRLVTQSNGGRSRARNTGIENAGGEYILFVDADDELNPGAIRRLAQAIREEQADAAVGSIEMVYEAHQEMRESDAWYYTIRQKGTMIVDDALVDDFHCSACAVLFRQSIIKNNALRFPDGLCYEDACWHWMYFTCCQKIAFVPQPVYRYWRHPQSIMAATFELKEGVAIQHLYVAEKIFAFWEARKELASRPQTVSKLLEAFFWLAFRYSQDFEKPRAVYECARIIHRFKIPVAGWENLCRISEGNLSFLFPAKEKDQSESDLRNYARFLQIKGVVDRVLPHGSHRRHWVYLAARWGWKIVLRFTGRTAK